MAYLFFDKQKLINLEYSLYKEILRTNRAGSYSSSTIVGCNTRKYHGLLVCPIQSKGNTRHVLLSALHETVIQHEKEFNLGIHKYSGNHYEPKGHKYIEELDFDLVPRVIYRVGGVVLSKEMVFCEQKEQVLLKYTLLEANSPTTLRLKPFLAFRGVHDLMKENLQINTKYEEVPNGISLRLYDKYPTLFMQINCKNDFVAVPDWYRGVEYLKEKNRGYEYSEDLYVPGYFEFPIKKGETVIFSASTSQASPTTLKSLYNKEVDKRIPRDSLYNNLLNAASQFFIKGENQTFLLAGYHWYKPRLRDTLVSIPGFMMHKVEEKQVFIDLIDNCFQQIENKFLVDKSFAHILPVVKLDAPLWLFWTLQTSAMCNEGCNIWERYGEDLKAILNYYKSANEPHFKCLDNHLIYAKQDKVVFTWMDSFVDGEPVTQRPGCTVEVNALWYNAIMYSIEEAEKSGDKKFVKEWKPFAEKLAISIKETFWNTQLGYLNDCVDGEVVDASMRPNQIFAVSLPYSAFTKEESKRIVDNVTSELFISKGLRTLSPQDPKYKGVVEGNVSERDAAIHQGAVWPWLLPFYVEAYFKIYQKSGVSYVKRIVEGLDEDMHDHCIGSIPEYYNGNPPHKGKGAISMAWNVSGFLRIVSLIEKYS